jgi:hypothetical protein
MTLLTLRLQVTIAQQFLWLYSLAFGKASILLLYAKIFWLRSRMVYMTACITIILLILWAVGGSLSAVLICRPFAFNWDRSIPGGICGNQILSYRILGAFNFLTDITVVALPIPYLCQLRMELYKKLVLISVFSIGIM